MKPAEGVAHDVQVVSQLLHHAVNAGSVLQNVHTLGVGVISHRERTLDRLGKLPAGWGRMSYYVYLEETI